jgi:hypothetical protein
MDRSAVCTALCSVDLQPGWEGSIVIPVQSRPMEDCFKRSVSRVMILYKLMCSTLNAS